MVDLKGMFKSKKDYNWSAMSVEAAIEEALSMVGADSEDKAPTTKGVAATLVSLGYPADLIPLGKKICEIAVKYEGEQSQTAPDGKKRRFVGTTWIGARAPEEVWNRHQWHLPLWRELQVMNAL